jgi:type VI secretion system protein VasJ
VQSGDWDALLQRSEQAFASKACHLWLDIQRFVNSACEGLGSDYRGVAAAIRSETSLVAARVPGLIDLKFSDGSLFCDSLTRQWLGALSGAGPATQSSAPQKPGSADSFASQRADVLALAAGGKLAEAVTMLRDAMRNSSSVRDNFRRSVLMGSLLMKARQPAVAIPVLESLGETIDEYHLERWDPDLALEALVEHLQAVAAVRAAAPAAQQAQYHDTQRSLLGRISRIDPARAIELGS